MEPSVDPKNFSYSVFEVLWCLGSVPHHKLLCSLFSKYEEKSVRPKERFYATSQTRVFASWWQHQDLSSDLIGFAGI